MVTVRSVTMAQWKNDRILLSVLPVARVQFPAMAEDFNGFSLADHTVLSQRGRKWLNLSSMTSHNLWKLRRKVEVQSGTENSWKKLLLMSSVP